MKPIVISFYSDIEGKDYYSRNAKRLMKELDDFDIEYDIQEKESLGDYRSNCLSKPKYILDKMKELNRPVIWLDIDSRVHRKLKAFDSLQSGVDVVFSSSTKEQLDEVSQTEQAAFVSDEFKLKMLINGMKASPLYFGNTQRSIDFLNSWCNETESMNSSQDPRFDHEPLFPLFMKWLQLEGIRIQCVGTDYCTWPRNTTTKTVITMGLADSETKKEKLREMGLQEEHIEWQSGGDKEHV
tara:strand:+ start:1811 stop:2530 length:720 start_codon:yes stop_codon:yes gene_type:complete